MIPSNSIRRRKATVLGPSGLHFLLIASVTMLHLSAWGKYPTSYISTVCAASLCSLAAGNPSTNSRVRRPEKRSRNRLN